MDYSYFDLGSTNMGDFADMYANAMSTIAQEDIQNCNGDVVAAKSQNALKYATSKFVMDSVAMTFDSGMTTDTIFANAPDMSKVNHFASMYLGRYSDNSTTIDFSNMQEDVFNFVRDLKFAAMENLDQNSGMDFNSIRDFMMGNNPELEGLEFSGEEVISCMDDIILNVAAINAESVGQNLDFAQFKEALDFDNQTWLDTSVSESDGRDGI